MGLSINGRSIARWGLVALAAVMTVALGVTGSAGAQESTTFRVTIENRSNPEMVLTPGAYLLSTEQDALWSAGTEASLGIERIAEIGDPAEAVSMGGTALDAAPANGDSITFEVTAGPGQFLSTAQMLVASNDAFAGLQSEPLFENGSPRSATIDLMAYDAGTEENAELFAGFDAGQPDPAQGADNVENGTPTSEMIELHSQFSGNQVRVTIAPVTAGSDGNSGSPAPASAGNAGLTSTTGGSALLIAALALLTTGLVFGARRVTNR